MELRGSESETKVLLLAGHRSLEKSDTDAVSYQRPRRERRPGARSAADKLMERLAKTQKSRKPAGKPSTHTPTNLKR
jgi:hypothetical protein